MSIADVECTVARENSLKRLEPKKKHREEPGSEGWPVLFWPCQVEIFNSTWPSVQTFIYAQPSQIIIITVVVECATGQHLRSKCQLAFHSQSFRVRDSRCSKERESKTAGPEPGSTSGEQVRVP